MTMRRCNCRTEKPDFLKKPGFCRTSDYLLCPFPRSQRPAPPPAPRDRRAGNRLGGRGFAGGDHARRSARYLPPLGEPHRTVRGHCRLHRRDRVAGRAWRLASPLRAVGRRNPRAPARTPATRTPGPRRECRRLPPAPSGGSPRRQHAGVADARRQRRRCSRRSESDLPTAEPPRPRPRAVDARHTQRRSRPVARHQPRANAARLRATAHPLHRTRLAPFDHPASAG